MCDAFIKNMHVLCKQIGRVLKDHTITDLFHTHVMCVMRLLGIRVNYVNIF